VEQLGYGDGRATGWMETTTFTTRQSRALNDCRRRSVFTASHTVYSQNSLPAVHDCDADELHG